MDISTHSNRRSKVYNLIHKRTKPQSLTVHRDNKRMRLTLINYTTETGEIDNIKSPPPSPTCIEQRKSIIKRSYTPRYTKGYLSTLLVHLRSKGPYSTFIKLGTQQRYYLPYSQKVHTSLLTFRVNHWSSQLDVLDVWSVI